MSTLKVKLALKFQAKLQFLFKLKHKLVVLFPILACLTAAVCSAQGPNLGRPLTPEEIKKVDITVVPDGRGLPPGSGSVSAGAAVYAKSCQSCHGAQGAGKPQD